jgi:hypothetical protein
VIYKALDEDINSGVTIALLGSFLNTQASRRPNKNKNKLRGP